MSVWSNFGATIKTFVPKPPSTIHIYRMIAAARRDFPFFLATIRTTSRNCLFPSESKIPKIADTKAFSHSSNLKGPGASSPSVWKVWPSIHSIASFAFFWSNVNVFFSIPCMRYSNKASIQPPTVTDPSLTF